MAEKLSEGLGQLAALMDRMGYRDDEVQMGDHDDDKYTPLGVATVKSYICAIMNKDFAKCIEQLVSSGSVDSGQAMQLSELALQMTQHCHDLLTDRAAWSEDVRITKDLADPLE